MSNINELYRELDIIIGLSEMTIEQGNIKEYNELQERKKEIYAQIREIESNE